MPASAVDEALGDALGSGVTCGPAEPLGLVDADALESAEGIEISMPEVGTELTPFTSLEELSRANSELNSSISIISIQHTSIADINQRLVRVKRSSFHMRYSAYGGHITRQTQMNQKLSYQDAG